MFAWLDLLQPLLANDSVHLAFVCLRVVAALLIEFGFSVSQPGNQLRSYLLYFDPLQIDFVDQTADQSDLHLN